VARRWIGGAWRGAAVVVALVAVAGLAGVPAPHSMPDDPPAVDRLRAALTADLAAHPEVPGEALAVLAPRLDVALAVGRADVATGTPLTPETPFRIASVTKTFVAAAVLRLVEQQRVALDAPVTRYLSRGSVAMLRDGGYAPRRITVRQLLDHTAGLFDYATTDAYDHLNETEPGRAWTRADQLRFAMEHGEPVAQPGAGFHYSDTGYVLLGEIVERRTGRSLAAAVRELLHFERLGMDDTYWEKLEPAPSHLGPRAHQYYDTFDNVALDASSDLWGGGGLVATVADVATFFRALLRGEVFDRPGTLRAMTEQSPAGADAGAALGLFARDVAGERCWSHPGYWGTEAVMCPRLDLAFARTTNQADDDGFDGTPLERVVVEEARAARRNGARIGS
jgi:D-alanyl-D-alanine carboxypeptidase